MRIQHPRATDAYDRDAPSQYAVRVGPSRHTTVGVDDEGYMSIKPSKADGVINGLEENYDVEYDRETGEVLVDAPEDSDDPEDSDEPEDEDVDDLPETSDLTGDDDGADEGEDDQDNGSVDDEIEAWTSWNREDWLSLGWKDRKSDVEDGLVDDHLEEIVNVESNQSKRVREAAQQRLEELED